MAYKRLVPLDSRVYCACGSFQIKEDMEKNIPIDELKVKYDDIFHNYFLRFCDSYYFIIHYFDESDEHIWHIHYILKFKNQIRLTTLINKISMLFDVDSWSW